MKNRILITLCVCALALCLSSCKNFLSDYETGSLMHPQVKSIALGKVVNETDEARLTTYARSKIPAYIQYDGSLIYKDITEKPDVILNLKIIDYEVRRSSGVRLESDKNNQRIYKTNIFRVTIEIEYQAVVRETRQLLVPMDEIKGRGEFTLLVDQEITRRDGLKNAMHDAASRIVERITEAW